MILYDLKCASGHVFEAWFKDMASFDAQSAAHEVECPLCGNREVVKAPMAPHVVTRASAAPAERPAAQDAAEARGQELLEQIHKTMAELRDHVEKNCDYVGERFSEEARRIHYGEVDPRGIYGEASDEQAKALKDEGIEFQRLAWLPRPKKS